ncbi:efflux RND transporter periplasmic adaptor subunit [Larsenimonas salina]|uniref:efflux RND transporter periplasmic adaptor subunit n=1 Tax=Larsenimonas salina TaxID=1295565 RepID=UPI00207381F5|nr:efflux RND transporter periplasmic adaptor subunit [Larsenimonas salina]MCM5703701.1 efflux RND transporter periplasmic adaptor subunit [Larsenimonas salina]
MSFHDVRNLAKSPLWLMLAASLLISGCSDGKDDQDQQGAQQKTAKKAQVETVQPGDLTLDREYPAKIRSDLSADIVARVNGVLEKQLYSPGETVEKGQTLFVIEQAQYQAAVDQAKADVESAKATLENERSDYRRYERLYKQNSVSQQQRDAALSSYRTAQASLEQAKAALDDAQIDLGYTTVKATTNGKVALNDVNVGNYVTSGTTLTEVTPLNPLEVRFSIPQDEAFSLRRQQGRDNSEPIKAQLAFPYANESDSTDVSLVGNVDFLGSRVDEGTSTVQARAVFDNPDQLFLPGLFVRVKLMNVKHFNALAVPQSAVTEGLKGPQLYILDEKNVIQSRFVTLGEQAGSWMIIKKGLKAGDRVVVSSIGSVSPGDKIDPQAFDGDPSDTPTDPSGKNGAATTQPENNTSVSGKDTSSGASEHKNSQ